LWRMLPVNDARSFVAWCGVMFSAGALHSVRLALTDLLAASLVALALGLEERRRSNAALGFLAAAGLARETAVVGVVGLWRGPWTSHRAWITNVGRATVVVSPLLLWMFYIRWKVGGADHGFGNFTWPVTGWIEKGAQTFADYVRHPNFRWLNTTTMLALIGLTVQAAYLLRRWHRDDPWWRVGMSGVAMMAMLGTAVWEGHPGAATRVLLPMGIAFGVLAVRQRASWAWVLAGSLTVLSGVQALWRVPEDPRELAAGKFDHGAYVARLGSGWYGAERHGRSAWAWSSGEGKLMVDTSPRSNEPVRVRLKVRAIAPRELQIRDEDAVVWQGPIGAKLEWIEINALTRAHGRALLEFRSDAPPVRENDHPDARALGFAVYGVEVR
jgi:hypothetical protein